MNKIAYVIFMTDEPVRVIIDDKEKANQIMENLKRVRYEKRYSHHMTYQEFLSRHYWHIHEVQIEE